MLISICEIKVSSGRREADPDDVRELADSIRELGLLHPIIVDKKNNLIAGLHRLEAAKLLDWTEIECTVSSLEGLQAELAEIDENVVRKGLSAVEFGELLLRRKEIYETLHPEARNGGDRKSEKIRNAKCNSDSAKAFVQDTAEKLGVSSSTVARQIQTAKNLTPEAKDILKSADAIVTKKDALHLSRLEPEQQKEAASMLASGEVRSMAQYKLAKVEENGEAGTLAEKRDDVPSAPLQPLTTKEPEMTEKQGGPVTPQPEAPHAPYRLPDKHFSSFAESVADLKDPNKDCSCTPDIFLAEFTSFVRKFLKEIQWFATPHYAAVFPDLTPVQTSYLCTQTDTIRTAAEDLLHQVERMCKT